MSVSSEVARIAGAKTLLVQKMKGAYPTPYDVSEADSLQELVALLDLGQGSTTPDTYPEATLADQIDRLSDVRDKLAAKMIASGKYDLTGEETISQLVTMLNLDPMGLTYSVKLSSPSSFTLSIKDNQPNFSYIEYTDGVKAWSSWSGRVTLTAENSVLYLRGLGNKHLEVNGAVRPWVLTGENISCGGNIENLLDYKSVMQGVHPTMDEYCFHSLFRDCTALITAPELPSTKLSPYCYSDMFRNTGIVRAPALPATVLKERCYAFMFLGCGSLTTPSSLPAVTLANSSYYEMYANCKSLEYVPELPAVTLADSCYRGMFLGCEGLLYVPDDLLPATQLENSCYYAMFQDCTSLKNMPKLPAIELSAGCYRNMFQGCESLIYVWGLPAQTATGNSHSYENMFMDCTALSDIPAIYITSYPSGDGLSSTAGNMFKNCTNIEISTTKSETYSNEFRIPYSGDFPSSSSANMIPGTGGTYTGWIYPNTTYYTSNTIVTET